jgi:alkanesulfonate monooxygenase SsuD/methylene tetrahydromethanopterin reductase-like flavin-dependent oxidoreductase (luciferase family)
LKFATFTHLPWPENTRPEDLYENHAQQVILAEELGFHSAWLAEHHFTRYGLGSSPLVIGANILARTKTIRLGTAVLVPPLHHPVRLAEEIAVLDVISGGRVEVGFGRGGPGYEFRGYNVDHEESQERFQEGIRVCQGLWTTPGFSYEGKYHQLDQANLVPPPIQKPHPPIYIAATRTLETLEFAVSTGHPTIVGNVQDTDDALDLCRRFTELSAEAGHNVPMSAIPFFRYIHVAPTEAEARQNTLGPLNWVLDVLQWRRTFQQGSEVYQHLDDWRRDRTELPMSYDRLYEKRAIIGTPEQCLAKILDLKKAGIEFFGGNFAFGGMEHPKVLKSMELFAKEVMPHLA